MPVKHNVAVKKYTSSLKGSVYSISYRDLFSTLTETIAITGRKCRQRVIHELKRFILK